MTEFQRQVQQLARQRLNEVLPSWLEEIRPKDMNSVAAQNEVLSRVYLHGVQVGIRMAQELVGEKL